MGTLPFTRKIVKDWAGERVFKDAMRIFEDGRVSKVDYDPPLVRGEIHREPRGLKTSLKILTDGSAENLCPCADNQQRGLICCHVIALCLEMLKIYHDPARKEKLEQEQRRARRLAEVDESAYLPRVRTGERGSLPAQLQLRLGADWQDQVRNQQPVSLHPELVVKKKEIPIDQVPHDRPVGLSEEDENVLFVLEDIAEGPVPGTLDVPLVDVLNLLELMPGRLWLDKTSDAAYTVNAAKMDSHLVLDLDRENGELILLLDTPLPYLKPTEFPLYLATRSRVWAFGGDNFWPLENILPEPLHGIYRNPVYIERKAVPLFLKSELELLQKVTRVETEISPDLFEIRPARPSFRLLVKGSPASLAATLYAQYPEVELIAGKPDPAGNFALPDPEDLLAYETRNESAEQQALARLSEHGFAGEKGDALEAIVGTREVLNFIATELPHLRRLGWKVDLEGRVAAHMDEVDYVTPVVQVQRPESAGWFEVGFEFETGAGENLSASQIQRAIRLGDSYVQQGGKTYLFDRDAITSMNSVFEDCASGEAAGPGAFRMNGIHTAYVNASLSALDGVDIEAPAEWTISAQRQNRQQAMEPVSLAEPLASTLRSYQKEGVSWMRFLEHNGFAGILADEMGLGKTLQTLAWMQLARVQEAVRNQPCLIVCPTSLVENWIEEAARFTPDLSFVNMTGADRHTRWGQLESCDVAVTSYALIRRDLEQYHQHTFAIIVLDEAQHIKNKSTQNAIAAKSLLGTHRLVLTGTPVENSVSDLWSIMDFLMPGYLGSHDHFKLHYESPISMGGENGEQAQQKLKRKLNPFMLRRLKKDVAKDLPPKIQKIASCSMTKDQQAVYQELVKSSYDKLAGMVSKQGFNKSRMEIFKTLLRLRQTCCHLDLLKLPDLKSKKPSGKMELFLELMEEAVDGGHRVLVFSQFTTMLGILARELEARNYRYCYLDGSTKNRMSVVKEFNTNHEIPAFLISLKAGGVGLNLTGADMVIHFDPWWNPAVEDQATDRAYRIGQKRTVYSLKLITRGTVEEKVLALQKKKQAVIDAMLTSEEDMTSSLTWEDVQELLEV